MKYCLVSRCVALAAVTLTVAACTMKEQEPAPLSGPSEFGQSLNVSVTPDILTQDGASQSVVTVIARGPNGAPLASLPLRAEIVVGGVATDFGKLSAHNIATDANGRATVVYTAPASPAGAVVDPFTLVNIAITPLGSDFGNAVWRLTTLRLVPPGGVIIAPPAGLIPNFTFTPSSPTDNQTVLFDANSSEAPENNPIAQYRWNFGDGATGTGVTTTHAYKEPGTYSITLSVVDAFGRSRDAAQAIIVTQGVSPIARFVASPTAQNINRDVFFNATTSTPPPGRTITGYAWNFGDNTTSNEGPNTRHAFARAGTYVVTLTVTDSVGRTNTTQANISIIP